MIIHTLHSDKKSEKLLIFFSGWGSEPSQFSSFKFKGYDIWMVYNYTSLEFSLPDCSHYSKVVMVAWSFGVWAAAYCSALLPELSRKIAVCGSMEGVDDKFGIPQKGFDLTVASIERVGVDKFNRRMCGDNLGYFTPSQRPLSNQVLELKALSNHFLEQPIVKTKWDYAIIATHDTIFPSDNLLNFWTNYCNFAPLEVSMPHFIFNKEGVELIARLLDEV